MTPSRGDRSCIMSPISHLTALCGFSWASEKGPLFKWPLFFKNEHLFVALQFSTAISSPSRISSAIARQCFLPHSIHNRKLFQNALALGSSKPQIEESERNESEVRASSIASFVFRVLPPLLPSAYTPSKAERPRRQYHGGVSSGEYDCAGACRGYKLNAKSKVSKANVKKRENRRKQTNYQNGR